MFFVTNFPFKLFSSIYPFPYLLASAVSNFANLAGSIFSSFLTAKYGIRPLLVGSSFVMALCMACLSVYYYFDMCPSYYFMCFFPFIIVLMFYMSLALGIGTIFFVIIGEKLPIKKRSLTMPLITVTMELLEAAQNFFLPLLISYMDTYGYGLTVVFGGHALANIASVIVVFLWFH